MLGLLAGGLPAVAHAQAYQCRMPERITVPHITPEAGERRVPVTGYTLSLSWAPEFCKPREGELRHALQCSGSNGRFGLVVHGLWPEGRSTWPQWCRTSRNVSPVEARQNLCMIPSANLVARQWAKHGSCMARTPEGYFKATRILWNSLTLPDLDRLSREDRLTAGRLREAFVLANPHWKPEMIGVRLNQRGWLEELRLCYGKDFMPARCNARQLGARDSAGVKIWRGL
ncbi:MAG: ribonuclease T2 family protein [Sphingomonadaceae bacterium]